MSIAISAHRNFDNSLDGRYRKGNKFSSSPFPLLALLPGAGRFSFYIDYSELSDVGTHTFYVARTHGSTGAVSVDYATAGDTHTAASGTLSWADGDMSIKSFTATVSSKSAGDHRIYATLSNPTGGAALHNGSKTKAYGVIDDGTIASDSDAVFFDADAVSNGTGTQASPYNNVYDAISNVGSKRYIYGKGTQNVTTQYDAQLFGQTNYAIPVPATRASEETRVYIRNWPGFTCTFSDGGNTRRGFSTYESTHSYHTYRGLTFSNLDNSANGSSAAISYYYGTCSDINIELCTASNLNGMAGTNSSAWALWGVDGGKVWRCTADGIYLNGVENGNAVGFQTYRGGNLSVQRSEFSNCSTSIFHKQASQTGLTSTSCRFNIFKSSSLAVQYSEQGASDAGSPPHYYPIVSSNFCDGAGIYNQRTAGILTPTEGLWATSNVFNACAQVVGQKYGINTYLFNNIQVSADKEFNEYDDNTVYGDSLAYLDYNCGYNTQQTPFLLSGVSRDLASMQGIGFATNNITSDPLITSLAADDLTLGGSSPCLGTGLGGSDMGAYLTGIEVMGA